MQSPTILNKSKLTKRTVIWPQEDLCKYLIFVCVYLLAEGKNENTSVPCSLTQSDIDVM